MKGCIGLEKLLVKGGNKLRGEVTISGAKNAAVAILPACLLVKGNCRIENLPDIKDVKLFLRILEQLNADVKYIDKNTVDIDCTNVDHIVRWVTLHAKCVFKLSYGRTFGSFF